MGVGSSIIGGLFGAASAGISAWSQNRAVDKQIQAQKEENQKTREYNLSLAEMQNQWNLEQWQRENEYNLPSNVVQRMKDAGLNPDLLYKNGTSNVGLAGNSPEMTAGAPGTPVDYSAYGRITSTYGQVIDGALRGAAQGAMIRKTEKEATKTDKETKNVVIQGDILSADALTRAAQNEETLNFTRSQVYVNHSVAEFNHQQTENLAAELNNINARYEQILASTEEYKARVRNVDSQIIQRRFDAYLRSQQFHLEVKKVMQEINESRSREKLNYQQVKDLIATLGARLYSLNAGAAVNEMAATKIQSEMGILSLTAEGMNLSLDQFKKYKDTLNTAQLVAIYLNSIGGFIGNVGSALSDYGSFKAPKGKLYVPPAQ